MDHKSKLEDLNTESLLKLEEYMRTNSLSDEDHGKLYQAKDEWQVAWSKLMETMLMLERLEI